MIPLPPRRIARAAAACALALGSCAAPSQPPPEPRAPEPAAELQEVRELLWQNRFEDAAAALESQGFRATGSVAAERMRQDLLIAHGGRADLVSELEEALALDPGDPDLVYLRARILEDPELRLAALERGAREHPGHPWLDLGVAATLQEFGRWQEAGERLDRVSLETAHGTFQRLLLARQLAHGGNRSGALRMLQRDALSRGHAEALLEFARIADEGGRTDTSALALAEYAVRAAAGSADRAAGMDRVIERLRADEPFRSRRSLEETLADLDVWCGRAGVPGGWSEQPRYAIGDLAELVQPESFRGGVASAWLAHGRFLLIGRAPGRGVDWLYLQDARRLEIPLASGGPAVEVIVARRGIEPRDRTIPGGAPFHGFFVRLDLVESSARRFAAAAAAFGPPQGWSEPESPPPGALEPFDLPTRLRARRLAAGGASARDLELLHLVLHETGHLPETLPWARSGVPLLGVAPAVLRSLWNYEDPILFLEERAQLRALACGVESEWIFAELVDRATSPRDPYYRPYRALLEELVEDAQAAGLPPLHAWDRLPSGRIAALARALLEKRRLKPLPARVAASALRGLDAGQSFEQLPIQDLAALLEHEGEVQAQRP